MEYLIYKDRNIETKYLNNMLKKTWIFKDKKNRLLELEQNLIKIKR